ncbi:response regulator transcription factor [Waterburya agarophytonicola K14]|uniref:Response regulator transcription factor n=1 Tax=Waterburya agarophytonicola KI4 TaxID=2874699 RepID=A0A964FFS1_9CYAN|nr:response regulator transcription factor [Waterburya agarophytonicola]MCC0177312.1 response regulator transcription factor [Waterburya agarophytonicola KI4]
MIRILIVDDQNLVQQGIKSLLDRDMEFNVIGTVEDGRDAIKQIPQLKPDVVLLDIEMPGMNGITTTKYINRISPQTKVIILSSHEDKKYIMAALMAGAKGYLLKTSLMTDLKQAILAVNNGYSQIDSRLLAKVFDRQNIKVKQTSSNVKYGDKKPDDSQLERDSSLVKNQKDRSKNTISLDEEISSTKFKTPEEPAEKAESVVTKSKTTLPSTKVASKLSKPDATSNYVVKKLANFSPNIPDSTTLEQIDPETSGEKSPSVVNQTALTTVIKHSSLEQYKFPINSSKTKKKTAPVAKYLTKLGANPRISRYKPQIAQLKSRLTKYQSKLKSLLKQKQKQDLLWNLGFILLGAAVVIIVGKI